MKQTMRYSLVSCILSIIIFIPLSSYSQQVSIVTADANPYNVSPRGLCQVAILNPGPPTQAVIQCILSDAANEPLLTVTTNPFSLHTGLNAPSSMNFTFSSVVYGSGSIENFMRNTNILPTGKYSLCIKITTLLNPEGDVSCSDLESDISSYLFLINPEDKDTVNSPYPILVWNHNDPYNYVGLGEYYRIIVCLLTEGQTPDEAIAVNTPVYLKNNLTELQVQYPFDAPQLEAGKHYAWQVQMIGNDAIINKSEAWEFVEPLNIQIAESKYAVMKTTTNQSFYEVANNRIFFRFDESYATSKIVDCNIYDEAMKEVKTKAKNSKQKVSQGIALQQQGYNQYEVDLTGFDIKSGFYYLVIKNGKGQKYMLKFHVD